MKVLTSWLKEFVNLQVSDEVLAETLTMTGLEVDRISTIVPDFNNVVVGEVLTCVKHPNAAKLKLCQVSIGSQTLQIICGAKNVRAGLKVIVAKNGATLPSNFKIKKAKLRGIDSNGMICSASEIGLANKSSGIMELKDSSEVGKNIRELLNLDDKIIELDITPNRGDCFSILGVAREVCANYSLQLNTNFKQIKTEDNNVINVVVSADKHCPKYLTRIISNIDNTVTTPQWMSDLLLRSGQSLHTPIVDITNFVLLEIGQPLHAFDRNKITGDIEVRLAKETESITLLNEQKTKLTEDTLIIADHINPLAIAGIMGGIDSSTTIQTTEIVLEAAFFDNILITGIARSYGLHTESSLRFERGVDYNLPEIAMNRTTELILEICGGTANIVLSKISEENLPTTKYITIKYSRINQILGFIMDASWIVQKFKDLLFEIVESDDISITVGVPSFRFDITIEQDLIEELARLYGYDKLPTSKLSLDVNLQIDNKLNQYNLKKILVARNYNEVITYSFISEKMNNITNIDGNNNITLLNPISKDMSIMRVNIIAGLLKTMIDNGNRGQNDLRIFESGLCFNGMGSNEQIEKIAGLITGKFSNNWLDDNRLCDFFDIKADVLSIIDHNNIKFIPCENNLLQTGQAADILIDGKKYGFIGALAPKIQQQLALNKCFIFEIDLIKLLTKNKIKYQQFSIYQSSSRDISMLFDKKISYQEIIDTIFVLKQNNLITVKLVDVWHGDDIDDNKQSLTFSLDYQDSNKTLTDNEIENLVNKVLKLLIKKYNAEQR